MSEVIKVDAYKPNYKRQCKVCEHTPTVDAVKGAKVVYHSNLCGVCMWGESRMLDEKEWNK
jgi:hypothetical protein